MTPTQLRQWRKERGWSQAEAAAALGRGTRSYQDLEAGKVEVQHETALACAWIIFHGTRDPWA